MEEKDFDGMTQKEADDYCAEWSVELGKIREELYTQEET